MLVEQYKLKLQLSLSHHLYNVENLVTINNKFPCSTWLKTILLLNPRELVM